MRRLSVLLRIIVLLVAGTVLAACSPSKFTYHNAPELLGWWLDGYLDLGSAQAESLRSELRQFQAWHRRQELPRYADGLAALAARLPGDLTPETVCRLADDTREGVARMARQIEPAAAQLALTIAPEQLRQLQRKFERNNAAYREKWLAGSPEERLKRRVKESMGQLEYVYGNSLGDAQRAQLAEQFMASKFDARVAFEERLRRQKDVVDTLQRIVADRPPVEAVREALRGLAERSLQSPDPAYRAYAERQQREGCAHLAALHNRTTPEQRAAAVKKIKAYETDLRALAAEAG